MGPQAIAAVPVAGAYVGVAALSAGIAYLATPQGQRGAQSIGGAIYDGGVEAVEDVKSVANAAVDLLTQRQEDARSGSPTATATDTATNTTRRACDGPHRGRLQVQGYNRRVDPHPLELSWPWTRTCSSPLRQEGLGAVSTLLVQTRAVAYRSAGWRGAAFSAMSKHIRAAPGTGFRAGHRKGFGVTPNGRLRPALSAGRNAPRLDLEVHAGRAFGDL